MSDLEQRAIALQLRVTRDRLSSEPEESDRLSGDPDEPPPPEPLSRQELKALLSRRPKGDQK